MMNSNAKEPNTAPPAEKWFPLKLGSTLREPPSSTRFYSLRYEFKPASIDTTRPGSLHKSTDNKATVGFCNNQAGKPKVSFQGNSEDCKDLDGILFFDGEGFRLERLHKAVKSLRHVRLPGESTGAAVVGPSGVVLGTAGNSTVEPPPSPGHLNGGGGVGTAPTTGVEKVTEKPPQVQVEEITIGQGETQVPEKKLDKRKADPKIPKGRISPATGSPVEVKAKDEVQVETNDDVVDDRAKRIKPDEILQVDVNIDEDVIEEHESDYEIEDVDVSEDEDGVNAADALRAQAAVIQKQQSSSESSESGSGSSDSGSGSGSSSSASEGSDDDEESGSSGDDI